MKKLYALSGLAISGLLVIGSALPATAATGPDALNQLSKLNPGISTSELKSSLSDYAKSEKISLDQAIQRALSESKESAKDAASAGGTDGLASAASKGGGSSSGVYLKSASRKGDIFVSPAATGFVQHGHTGIYYTTGTIVEAPGTKKRSRSIGASNYKVARGAVKQYIKTTSTQRGKAANHAYNKLRGKDYNTNFAFNKSTTGSKMNCSQLVWAAYKAATGIDLDGNGGPGVYPYNIKDSSKTTTYKTL
ncbi:hypothetical protein AOZ07_11540 [Glutamicibacter halophytocola]|uniref:YiiX/YebB-like N1pC/P60 family cysteine hydrolase n=1 Tax=Glutamicibacter halophytocola TaxID=1933880 RepID=UPI0006D4BFB1|nr:YiiX/YebB-like N1pC/P60 family cysteine hydrolase [Glutamicibacter halophytocola]ALG29551.1 hypothetical protein AOZ07_11540 [Glutamicibacter halophytocola]